MPDTITMTTMQYEQLLKSGQRAVTLDGYADAELTTFLQLRKTIDLANGIRRYVLAVRFTAAPEKTAGLTSSQDITQIAEFLRPPTKEDVLTLIENEKPVPGSIYVSADPSGILGFYELDKFPWQ